ncbi:MAG TPA: hydrogenase formation protein HypD [bacterium (Candidatus Stahlbacteria)]|nr:hydrogenase formation protein HypD [Candidatus Stahlbacteria bacterium]
MKYIDEFRDSKLAKGLRSRIKEIAQDRKVTLMEVCGTHTMAIARFGIKSLLPKNIKLLSGPGCPVCVTPTAFIDRAIAYSREPNIVVATFGDMMKVPGSTSSLWKEKSKGMDIRIVYSVAAALKFAKHNPNKKVIFLAVGFETTVPSIATSIIEAQAKGIANFFVLCGHKLIPPVLKALLDSDDVRIDGFILPGHVSTITGTKVYEFIPKNYGVACCVSGFEPLDVLYSILKLVESIANGEPRVDNEYRRAVREDGNIKAKSIMQEVFDVCDTDWRGIGRVDKSGLRIKDKYGKHDALIQVKVEPEETREYPDCICGEILRGVKTPLDCKLFKTICNPQNALGPCMVSSEGTCAAYYKYGG